LAARFLIAHANDSVAIALTALECGEEAGGVILVTPIPVGHKFAVRAIASGEPIIKLGHAIGLASAKIASGAHVHDHNLAFAGQADRANIGTELRQTAPQVARFQGIVRADGRVGTRNFIAVLTSVNCSATVAKRIAAHFTPERLAAYPNVDGVIALGHSSGCGMAKEGRGIDNLRRTIAGYATHPNVAATLLVGLGCEVNQIDPLLETTGLVESKRLRVLGIQDSGGTLAAIAAGIAAVEAMLPEANSVNRQPVSAARLTIGLQCGASDGFSALTANPALGAAADLVVAAGGKVILSETPEVFGAEDLLLRRAASSDVAQALIDRLDWWEAHAAREGMSLDNNPSPGNKAGGITTILEKSLGAVAKAGTSPLNAVIDYAAPVTSPGLTFMDSPGYDPASATGQIAGGANLIMFTTGRGSVFGSLPAPTLKLASNAHLATAMAEDIDIDCSSILAGESLAVLGERIFAAILDCASGTPSASERLGLGEAEFVPWVPGVVY
jgi:altronate hydrolase